MIATDNTTIFTNTASSITNTTTNSSITTTSASITFSAILIISTWLLAMVIAAAEVNPAMTGTDMKSIRNPSLSRISMKGDARKVKQGTGMKSI